MVVKIAICDDEEQQTTYIRSLILKWANQQRIMVTIFIYDSAEALLFAFSEDQSYDIVLLDIQMGGKNGIELAKTIRQTDETMAIIFITGYSDYMAEGYEVSALQYLIKPLHEEKLYHAMTKACSRRNQKEKVLIVQSDGSNVKLLQKDIMYAEVFAHTVLIQTTGVSYEVKMRISDLEKQLDDRAFIRCHRSYLVGLNYIQRITRTEIVLDGGKHLPLSRRLYDEVNQAFIRYFRGEVE